MVEERTIREGIRHAKPDGEHLREDDTPSDPGIPEAVNLEREDPLSDAARRRDAFAPQEEVPARNLRAQRDARAIARGEGKPGAASETTESAEGRNLQGGANPVAREQSADLE